ncbi:low-affinity Fe(2+) transport protein [Aspergillus nanangensis]|uniref:Low-affinity Fe(2+) transport protein n=1 Tax=Aspergillus nanangensis TaxID=2582783 RepID=A0AAD4CLA3_ASPNN|nr:low-affinity Fe(2+) transport protein [Aspergillus nanangensis]
MHPCVSNVELPQDTRFSRCVAVCAHVLGHLGTMILFWIGVFVWIGLGPACGWSNDWQLYMNSASSALMVFLFPLLANLHEQQSAHVSKCLDAIFAVDAELEVKLRMLTGDHLSNIEVVMPAPKVNPIQRAIFYYADFVGTLVGMAILLAVVVIWIAVGPLLHFSSNWWLLIGTYAGLVGMNDAFVLRNMQDRLRGYAGTELGKIHAEDAKLLDRVHLSRCPAKKTLDRPTLTTRVSLVMSRISAHEITVVVGFVFIIGLVVAASAMGWSLTGQLLCNVPASIVESCFMLILISGHKSIADEAFTDWQMVYKQRVTLLSVVECVQSQWRRGDNRLTASLYLSIPVLSLLRGGNYRIFQLYKNQF